MKTFVAKPSNISKKWYLIDAKDLVPGRLSALVARWLRGKHKATFTPHMDCGDNIIVINAAKVRFTGRKYENKTYYRHTGHPGGIKSVQANQILQGKFPERVLEKSITRMMPGGPLTRKQLKNLHIYAADTHPHEAQKPEFIDVSTLNRKNVNLAN